MKNDRFLQSKKLHDHPADDHAENIRLFKEQLKPKVKSDFRDIKDIYDDVSKE